MKPTRVISYKKKGQFSHKFGKLRMCDSMSVTIRYSSICPFNVLRCQMSAVQRFKVIGSRRKPIEQSQKMED